MANSTGLDEARVSFKVVLLGEGAVGKTSLLLRYVENKFNDRHIQTLQVSFKNKIYDFVKHVRTIVFYFVWSACYIRRRSCPWSSNRELALDMKCY